MRVALVDPSLFTLPYDAALARALAAAGHHVVLHARAPRAEDGDAAGLEVAPDFYPVTEPAAGRRPLPGPLRLLAKGLDHGASMLRLLARLRRERPDVIHFQWLPLPALDRAVLPALRRIAPLVLTVHDTEPSNGDASALRRAGFLACLRGMDRLVVHTAQGESRLRALGLDPARIARMPHPPLLPVAAGTAPDAEDAPPAVLLLGKIQPYKGADLLVEAFARLPEALRAAVPLRIVGKPMMDLAPLRALAEARGVALDLRPGFVPDEAFAALLSPGTIAAFPYREIEASGVLGIALARGRPVVASRLGTFAEVLDAPDPPGIAVPPGDAAALAAALERVLTDRALAARMSARALDIARDTAGWAESAAAHAALYEAARSTAARPPQ
ncbi:glycosyltransferase [Pararoseomonas sp. SCSIO 73927]|uniref:glycosyltransferase n=1 Tax=Pararoseomonas sp. SCSIO 73927 TaxID=3114537 RepID=UPI0030D62317